MNEACMIDAVDAIGQRQYLISASRRFKLPAVDCPKCGEIVVCGPAYPTLNVAGLDDSLLALMDRREPLSVAELDRLRQALADRLGPERPLVSYTGLGPLEGTAEGMFNSFAWPSFGREVLVRRSVFEAIQGAGFAVSGVTPALRYRREREDPLIELELPPVARLHTSQRRAPCGDCGSEAFMPKIAVYDPFPGREPEGLIGRFFSRSRRKPLVLDRDLFDPSIPFQRIRERPDVMLASGAMADFIRENELTDIALVPLPMK